MAKIKKPAPKKGGKKNAASKKVVTLSPRQQGKSAAAAAKRKPSRPYEVFTGADTQLAIEVAAAAGPYSHIEFHAETRNYGWQLALAGSMHAGGDQYRTFTYVDFGDGVVDARMHALWVDSGSREAFVRAWAAAAAPVIAKKLGELVVKYPPLSGEGLVGTALIPPEVFRGPVPEAKGEVGQFHDTKVHLQPKHPTVEEQFAADYAAETARRAAQPAPAPPGPKSKFWRQYQDTTTGEFIGWRKALTLAKSQVVSRLRLRKPQP